MRFKESQAEQFQRFQKVTTLEDHLRDGGFGSWLAEALISSGSDLSHFSSDALDPRVCGTVGSQRLLEEYGGLIA